jgi:Amt family ammonium transporter
VGWFGFNAGSALEANATAALAFLNTLLATAAAVLAWSLVEKLVKGKSSALGVASGMVAGLVGITPAAGTVGPFGAIAIGVAAGAICVWGVTGLKKLLNADDTLDVFGVHGVGGIVGAILTGVFTDKALGGAGYAEGVSMGHQVLVQATGVGVTVVWIGVVSVVGFLVAKLVFGLRVSEEAEREGLDITSHGEAAYES